MQCLALAGGLDSSSPDCEVWRPLRALRSAGTGVEVLGFLALGERGWGTEWAERPRLFLDFTLVLFLVFTGGGTRVNTKPIAGGGVHYFYFLPNSQIGIGVPNCRWVYEFLWNHFSLIGIGYQISNLSEFLMSIFTVITGIRCIFKFLWESQLNIKILLVL